MDGQKPKARKQGSSVSQQEQQVDPIIGEAVGAQLKNLFDEFASEAVPDRFVDLIGRLEASEADAAPVKGADE